MSIRLLLAEGDPAAARMLEASLSRYGFEVTHAADGEAAIQGFSPRAFDVVLLDVSLPRKSGIEAAKAIRTSPGGNQVGLVLTSGNTVSVEVVLELRRAQVDAWFNKPLQMRDLRDKLAELAHRYTGATTEALPLESGRRALHKAKTPVADGAPGGRDSQAVARAAVATATQKAASGRAASEESGKSAAAAAAPPSQSAPQTVRITSADARAAVALAEAGAAPGRPSSSPGFAVPKSGSERASPPAAPLSDAPQTIGDVHAAARTMLALARARVTGIYALTHRDAEVRVAFINGVMVGAMDTSVEHRLLSRLVRRDVLKETDVPTVLEYSRAHKLRAAEAVLALDYCDAETLLDELEQQAAARLVLAAGWRAGEMRFVADKAEVERLAISSFDAYEAVFRRFDAQTDPVMVNAWLERAADLEFNTSRDFEDGLVAYARIAPLSPLPQILFSRPPNLRVVDQQIAQLAPADRQHLLAHVYGMWVAGLLRLPNDVIVDERPVPRPLRSDEVGRAVPDKEACSLVRAEWLRAQGRNYYEVLGLLKDAPDDSLWGALASYRERFGSETLGQKNIGPVVGLAAELWALIDDIETTLLDKEQRAFYDSTLEVMDDPSSVETNIDADAHFLEGKLALSQGDIGTAKSAFEVAAEIAPDNLEYKSFLAWTEFVEGATLVESAMAALRAAAEADLTAMRPIHLIGLAAERLGNLEAAKAAYEEALQRAPRTPEVESALLRVKAALGG